MRQADMRIFFQHLPVLLAIMVSAMAMRLWAEERKSGSVELLFTLPITVTQAVIGKFMAAWTFLAIALLLTFPVPATVCYLGDPDFGLIVTGYLGSLLMAGGFLAIGSFFSALSKNQVISFILAVVACAVLVLAGMPTTLNYLSAALPAGMLNVVESLLLDMNIFFLLGPIVSMVLTVQIMKWNAVSIERLPGFQRLIGLVLLAGAAAVGTLIVSKTRFYVLATIGDMAYLMAGLFGIMYIGYYLLFCRDDAKG